MKDAFDVLMITHAGLCKGYADALKLILDIDEDISPHCVSSVRSFILGYGKIGV